jgi:hypothetical protein
MENFKLMIWANLNKIKISPANEITDLSSMTTYRQTGQRDYQMLKTLEKNEEQFEP